eukprot:m.70961 g.70961  ORF g.70961 m.70961 type:complete len:163 (+) comp18566_c0_seq1:193-681(+)
MAAAATVQPDVVPIGIVLDVMTAKGERPVPDRPQKPPKESDRETLALYDVALREWSELPSTIKWKERDDNRILYMAGCTAEFLEDWQNIQAGLPGHFDQNSNVQAWAYGKKRGQLDDPLKLPKIIDGALMRGLMDKDGQLTPYSATSAQKAAGGGNTLHSHV